MGRVAAFGVVRINVPSDIDHHAIAGLQIHQHFMEHYFLHLFQAVHFLPQRNRAFTEYL